MKFNLFFLICVIIFLSFSDFAIASTKSAEDSIKERFAKSFKANSEIVKEGLKNKGGLKVDLDESTCHKPDFSLPSLSAIVDLIKQKLANLICDLAEQAVELGEDHIDGGINDILSQQQIIDVDIDLIQTKDSSPALEIDRLGDLSDIFADDIDIRNINLGE